MLPGGYHEDLAYIHDVGFGCFAQAAAPELIELFARRGIHSGLVVDLGCGSGIVAQALTTAGFDLLGVDQSQAMIDLARVRAPAAEFRTQALLDTRFPACAAVTALGEILCYCFDERLESGSLEGLFRRVYKALEKGGLFVFDVGELSLAEGPNPQKNFWQGADWALLMETRKNLAKARIERHLTTFRRRGKSFRRSEEIHRRRLFEPSKLESVLREVGFRVKRRRAYGSLPLLPGRLAFFAAKPD